MKRNKYLNTFDTTAEYDNYIESAYPEFPNVGLTKDDGNLHYMRTSPNDHVWYGEVVDPSQALPTISINGTVNTPTLDTINNMFYLDTWSNTTPKSITFNNKGNIKTIKKMKGLDTSNVTNMYQMFSHFTSLISLDLSNWDTSNVTNISRMFYNCASLTSLDLSSFDISKVTTMQSMFSSCIALTLLDLSNWDISNVTNMGTAFQNCNALTDVYITTETTLMKLTNNLTSQSSSYIPSNDGNCTIHYNDVDYKWQNNAWTPQN